MIVEQSGHPRSPARASALEIACGHGLGLVPAPPEEPVRFAQNPLAALEAAIEPALRRAPCLVSFSGGVDSTLVLAVAVALARRLGLAEPVPITWRFPSAPGAEESRWQEEAISALGLADWERLAAEDELDLVGPVAQRVLRRHGLLVPANSFLHEPLLARAGGGSLLSGFGGDQVLGLWRGRSLADVFAGRRRPSARTPLTLARALAPPRVRHRLERRRLPALAWLSAPARRRARELLAAERSAEPYGWAAHLRWQLRRRENLLAVCSLQRLGDRAQVMVCCPLLDRSFIAALTRAGGRLGFGDRSATVAALFGTLSAGRVLARTDKARFDEVFWGPHTRALVSRWDGEDLDPAYVDAAALARLWSDGPVDARTSLLVQQLWLARQRRERPPRPSRV